MALFGNSTIINEIHREVGSLNDNLRKLETNLISNGSTILSNNYMNAGRSHYQTIQSLLSRISDREFRQLSLCWMDGRYLPVVSWNLHCANFINQLINKYNL